MKKGNNHNCSSPLFLPIVTVLILCGFFSNCRLPEIKLEAPAVNTVKKGAKFRINLPENHIEGYNWQLKQDFDKRVVRSLNEVWHGNEKGIDFNLQAHDTGRVTLLFTLRKYTDTASYKRFNIHIADN